MGKPFGLNSKYARDNALPLSIAIQLGHVTTEFAPNKFGKKYLATQDGIDFYKTLGTLIMTLMDLNNETNKAI